MQIRVSCPGRGIPRQSKVRARPKHHLPQRSLRAKDRSRGAHPKTPSGAGAVRSEHRRRSPKSLAQSAKAPSSPEPSCEHRTNPAEPTQRRQAERDRSEASIEGDHLNPRAKRESSILPRAFLRAQDRSRGAHQQHRPPTAPRSKPLTLGVGLLSLHAL
jgi:hypothetical protein